MNAPALLVADASVAAKWWLTEEHSERARRFAADWSVPGRVITAPPHLYAEVTNVFFQRTLRSDPIVRISEADARQALSDFLNFPIRLQSPDGLFEQAYDLARTHTLRSIYDALYVALARILGCDLWTADRRLLDALGSAAPWVRFIGDYQGAT